MNKLLLLWAGCLCALTAQAAGDEWLVRLQQAVRALGAYEVRFSLATTDGYTASGSCRVAGERYLIELPRVLVFCDGEARYEVNEESREVVVDRVDTQSNNLLDNPVRAFDFAGEQYAVEVLAETAERIELRLTPRAAGSVAAIDLVLDKSSVLPTAVTYGAEEVKIMLTISSFKSSSAAFPPFGRSDFPQYVWIDFR